MNVYENQNLGMLLAANTYPGRGIVVGKTADGKKAAAAYFIMGRSENSRNRVFSERGDDVYTEPFDASRVQDPSLIIYAAIRRLGNQLIVTNGDQTDTIYQHLAAGRPFEDALETRCFEPDGPNFTPRISSLLTFGNGDFTYQMSILKSADAEGSGCSRYFFRYHPVAGVGHFIHTYACDGNPLPTFTGEPERVAIPDSADEFADCIWRHLNHQNRISLYVRMTDLADGHVENRLINQNK